MSTPFTVIQAIAVGSNLVDSTAPESGFNVHDDCDEYDDEATYDKDERCYIAATHRVYISKVDANADSPIGEGVTSWTEVGYTNRHKAFDQKGNTFSTADSPYEFILTGDWVAGMHLEGMRNVRSVRIQASNTALGTYYDNTIELQDTSIVDDYYDVIFVPIRLQRKLTVLDILPQPESTYTITLRSEGDASPVSIESFVMGEYTQYGYAEFGPQRGIVSYGKVIDDGFGATTLKKGNYAKTLQLTVHTSNDIVDAVVEDLDDKRETFCVFAGAKETFELMSIAGFYEDFYVAVPNGKHSKCHLKLRSLS